MAAATVAADSRSVMLCGADLLSCKALAAAVADTADVLSVALREGVAFHCSG